MSNTTGSTGIIAAEFEIERLQEASKAKSERIAELEHVNEGLGFEIIEIEKERESLLRLISYVKSIVFSKVKCSYVSFKRPLEELLKDQGNG